MNKKLLTVENLSWGVQDKEILSDINFDIKQGDFVGLIGPNGAGKSSLMRCLYRVNNPSKGCVAFNGQDIWQCSARMNAKNIAVILQDHTEQLGLTVTDVITQGLTPHKHMFEWDTPEDRRKIDILISEVDLSLLRDSPFNQLSGGEKQRVMLARAMLQNPQLLIMDEPTNHLDVHYQVELLQKVKKLAMTVLASFHDLNLAAAFCDAILLIDHGKILAYGKPEDVITEKNLNEIFNTKVVVDKHPMYAHPRITYAYHE
ncbi:MAG: iron complex transport system ATP-binding protein [Pseudohongiellaceae bacterium]|jgi:iron complex transport system ATP-binding protein